MFGAPRLATQHAMRCSPLYSGRRTSDTVALGLRGRGAPRRLKFGPCRDVAPPMAWLNCFCNLLIPKNAAEFWTAFAASATAAAVLVALGHPMVAWLTRPRLKVRTRLKPPDCQTQWVTEQGTPQAGGHACYLRRWIRNGGKRPADNVHGFLSQSVHARGPISEEDPRVGAGPMKGIGRSQD